MGGLQEAVERFQGLAEKVRQATASRYKPEVACPEGFDFIKSLPQAEVQRLSQDIQDLGHDIKKKVGGIAGMNPTLAYNLAYRRLTTRLGVYDLTAWLTTRKEEETTDGH